MIKKINNYLNLKKMKKIMILLFTIASFAFVNQQKEELTIKATFDGFEEGIYYFTEIFTFPYPIYHKIKKVRKIL